MRKLVIVLLLLLVLVAAISAYIDREDVEYEMEDDFLADEDSDTDVLSTSTTPSTPAPAPPINNNSTTSVPINKNSTTPAEPAIVTQQKQLIKKVKAVVKKAHVRKEVWELINKNVNQDKESLISGSFKHSSKELNKGLFTWKHCKTGKYLQDELSKATKVYNSTSIAAKKLKKIRGKFYRKFMRVAMREVSKYKDYSLKILNLYAVSVPLVSTSNKELGKIYEDLEALWSAIYTDSQEVQSMVGEMRKKLKSGTKAFVLVDGAEAVKSIKENRFGYWNDLAAVQEFQKNVIDKYTPLLQKLGVKKPSKVLYELKLLELSKYATALGKVAKTLKKDVIVVKGPNRPFNSYGYLLTAQLSLQNINYKIVKAADLKTLKL